MSRLSLEGFKLDLRHANRINEILDAYRIKLTGSLECRKENRIYDFIYREQPSFTSEILMIMYQIGYEDGKKAARQADLVIAQDEQDDEQGCVGIDSDKPIGGKANLRLVVDNTINRPDPDPPPANTAVGSLVA